MEIEKELSSIFIDSQANVKILFIPKQTNKQIEIVHPKYYLVYFVSLSWYFVILMLFSLVPIVTD